MTSMRFSRPILAILAAMAAGLCPLASAQSLRVNPFNLTVNYQRNQPSGNVLLRSLEVTNVTTRVVVSTTIDGPSNVNWLFVSPLVLNASEGATRRLDVTMLPGPLPVGTFTGTVRLTPDGGAAAVVVPISIVVSDLRMQNAIPSALEFVVQRNSGRSASQPIGLTATSGTLSIIAAAQSSPTAWLQVDPGPVTTPTALGASVLPDNLVPGDYTGSIVFTAAGGVGEVLGNPAVTIPVRLRVVDDSRLSVAPNSITFEYQLNAAVPAPRTVAVGSTGSPINFTVEVATPGTNVPWLGVSPLQGATPQNLSIGLQNAANLPAGTFTGTVTVKGANAQNEVIGVTVRVATDPLLSVTPGQLTFTFQQGSTPPRQVLTASNPGNPVAITVVPIGGTSQWLTVYTPTANTPAAVALGPSSPTLSPGVYEGAVEISGKFGNSPLVLPVRVVVAGVNQSLLRISQNPLNFAFQTGGAATTLNRTLDVASTGSAIQYTATGQNGAGWLSVAPQGVQTTPSPVSISVTPGSLPPGIYNAQISVQTLEANALPIVVPVRMVISTQPLLSVSPAALAFNVTGATSPLRQSISVASTGAPFAYQSSATVAGGGTWLVTAQSGANTGSTVEVGVNPVVTEGSGVITITAAGVENSPVFVPVTLSGTGPTSQLTILPSQLDFVQVFGGAVPAAQTLDISLGQGAGLIGFRIGELRYLIGTGWLKVSKTAGIAPDKVDVTIDATNLQPGRYAATIPFESSVGNRDVVVFLEVRRVVIAFTANPETLTFAYTPGAQNPPPQQIQIGSSGDAIPFTAEARVPAGVNSWLTVGATSATTPAQLNVSVNPSGLSAGTYQGTIILTGGGGPVTRALTVTLTVAAGATPNIVRVVNAASFLDVPAVPGMIISLVGTALGPVNGVAAAPNAAGIFERQLANAKVTFDGIEAPILFVSASQINAIVPYLVASRLSTRVQVEVNGIRSNGIDLRVGTAAPGIFMLSAAGQGAILNQDTTVNGGANPAPRESVIVIYATGEGQTNPPGVDGTIPARSTPLKTPIQRVRVRIGGQEADVLYAGSAPFLVSGALQVNAKVPLNVAPGSAVPIELIVGDVASAAGVTVAIR